VGGLSGAHCCDSRGEGGKGGEVVEAALSYGRVEGAPGRGLRSAGGVEMLFKERGRDDWAVERGVRDGENERMSGWSRRMVVECRSCPV
jgi:hypothetical protein